MSQHSNAPTGEEEPPYRLLREFLYPERTVTPGCIILPYNAGQFRFKNGMIQTLQHYHGMDSEKPYLHIREFEDVCDTLNDQTCTQEVIHLKLFPFSLKDKAKT